MADVAGHPLDQSMGLLHPTIHRLQNRWEREPPGGLATSDIRGFFRRQGDTLHAELTQRLRPRVAEAFAGGGLFSLARG